MYVPVCVVWTEKNTGPGNGKKYCGSELEREKDREALICIEMMEREGERRWRDRIRRPAVVYLLCLDH